LRERIEELERVADKSIQARADVQMWSGGREDHVRCKNLKPDALTCDPKTLNPKP
jgi:hypothetical protein